MPDVSKVTMLFELTTQGVGGVSPDRVGGWSESWYVNGDAELALVLATGANGLLAKRAGMLPFSGNIVGIRCQKVSPLPVGPTISRSLFYNGNPAWQNDIPQVSLLFDTPGSAVANTKRYIARGIPDQFVVRGEYRPDVPFQNAVTLYITHLVNVGYRFRCIDLSNPKIAVVSYTAATKTFITATPHGLAIADKVRIYRLLENGTQISKTFDATVGTVPGANSFTAFVPEGVLDSHGGKMRKIAIIFPTVSPDMTVERVVTRRVGRPFDLYRGRQ